MTRPAEADPPTVATDMPTAAAPLFVAPSPPPPPPSPLAGLPPAGDTIGEFLLVRVLGSGAFARVYLARQLSLERFVALKVSRNRGREAQALAKLEHPHIVAIFSEGVDADRDLHLLCMQYVAGTTLESVIAALGEDRTGRAFLDAIDGRVPEDTPLDRAALRDREQLAGMDAVEAVCWVGARLADALAHAHFEGVLHRDVKPANVLVNRGGQPLLADFNVAQMAQDGDTGLGGTPEYMSPEHLEAFTSRGTATVDAAGDVYALGLVLYQLYTGALAFGPPPGGMSQGDTLRHMARERRAGAPPLSARRPAPPPLERVIARCLAGDPAARYADAAELAVDLDSCRELHRARRELPPPRPLTRWALAAPLLFLTVMIPLPHVVATAVNIFYNFTRIPLTDEQKGWFLLVTPAYNAVAYPCLLGVFLRRVVPVFRAWGELGRGGTRSAGHVEAMRLEALTLPGWLAGLSCLGWLPGGVVFPAALHALAGPVPPAVWWHFVVSFTLSGLIAIAYSAVLMELLVVRVIYPGLFLDARNLRDKARHELRHEERRLAWLQFLAVLIPVAGASLLLGVGPEEAGYPAFRVLVTGLLAAGMLGLGLAEYAAAEVRETVTRMKGR